MIRVRTSRAACPLGSLPWWGPIAPPVRAYNEGQDVLADFQALQDASEGKIPSTFGTPMGPAQIPAPSSKALLENAQNGTPIDIQYPGLTSPDVLPVPTGNALAAELGLEGSTTNLWLWLGVGAVASIAILALLRKI